MTSATNTNHAIHCATAVILALVAGCSDPVEPQRCEVDERAVDKLRTANRLGSKQLMFNALLTNPEANQALIAGPLRTEAFDPGRCSGDGVCLGEQLTDPWAQELLTYMVECALDSGQKLTWTDPATGQTTVRRGSFGLCPRWHDVAIDADVECQELVTACVLARNNAFGVRVPLSVRGVREGVGLPLAAELTGEVPEAVVSTEACRDAGGVDAAEGRDCSWESRAIGVCQPGTPVELASPGCAGDVMLRVCDGDDTCDARDALAAAVDACSDGRPGAPLAFTCGDSATFTVMTAPREPGVGGLLPLTEPDAAAYPIAEDRYFHWMEGAFYGRFFGPDAIDSRIAVRVEDGHVVYTYTDPASPDVTVEYRVYNTECNADPASGAAGREGEHDAIMADIAGALGLGGDTSLAVYPSAYSCWSPVWNEGAAYAKQRICAGPTGTDFCAAKPIDQCWRGATSDANLCQVDDSAAQHGDRDHADCSDDQGRIWSHPLTVFLDDACALVPDPDACAALLAGVKRVTSIRARRNHTCVTTDGGELRCWGNNEFGQLGYGHTQHVGDDELPASPGAVDLPAVAELSVGGQFVCGLLDGGGLRCWGENDEGQLGDGTQAPRYSPPGADVLASVIDAASGAAHTCAIVPGGTVRCFGERWRGRLGVTPFDPGAAIQAPVQLDGEPLVAKRVALGEGHSCAVLGDDTVACWGAADLGQLGLGDGVAEHLVPVGLTALGPVAELTAGAHHTCAVLSGRTAVRCWGNNNRGQLGVSTGGQGVGDDEPLTAIAAIDTTSPVAAIVAGLEHTCALLDDATVRCWGSNQFGQLGYVEPGELTASRAMTLGPVIVGGPVAALAAGTHHTCALLADGAVRCWGSNTYGQLGHGASVPSAGTAGKPPIRLGNVPIF